MASRECHAWLPSRHTEIIWTALCSQHIHHKPNIQTLLMCLAPNTTIKSNSLPLAFSVSRYYLHTFYVRYDQHHSKCSTFFHVFRLENMAHTSNRIAKRRRRRRKKQHPDTEFNGLKAFHKFTIYYNSVVCKNHYFHRMAPAYANQPYITTYQQKTMFVVYIEFICELICQISPGPDR